MLPILPLSLDLREQALGQQPVEVVGSSEKAAFEHTPPESGSRSRQQRSQNELAECCRWVQKVLADRPIVSTVLHLSVDTTHTLLTYASAA